MERKDDGLLGRLWYHCFGCCYLRRQHLCRNQHKLVRAELDIPNVNAKVHFFFSWTVITWIINIGSSVVMLLWIVIYSFFESSDFNDEVVVLFGEVTFWATVLISVFAALGRVFILLSMSVC